MLTALIIRNFTIIKELALTFEAGMTVLTGETGAGKSILVDALSLVLGGRSSPDLVRPPAKEGQISAIFTITDGSCSLKEILSQAGISYEEELIVRRVISTTGKSRCFINDIPLSLQRLKTITQMLVDIHGQHEHLSLFSAQTQRQILDEYGHYKTQLKEVKQLAQKWHETAQSLNKLGDKNNDHNAQVALLEYQVDELTALATDDKEYDALVEEHQRLSHMHDLIRVCQESLANINQGDKPAASLIYQTLKNLQSIEETLPELASVIKLIDQAYIQLTEANDELREITATLSIDPERFNLVEVRLDKLHYAAQKHKIAPDKLSTHLTVLSTELNDLKKKYLKIKSLLAQQANIFSSYQKMASALHKERQSAALKLSQAATKEIVKLGMVNADFTISVQPSEDKTPTAMGIDQIHFFISTNPGQPTKSISKIASGGELSRIGLAIQVVSMTNNVPVMVFDEIDTGIGGQTAELVGILLETLAQKQQVFCITHLPQIAAFADHHIKINKTIKNKQTYTSAIIIDDQKSRIEEISRMLGGTISQRSRAHAEEMLAKRTNSFS